MPPLADCQRKVLPTDPLHSKAETPFVATYPTWLPTFRGFHSDYPAQSGCSGSSACYRSADSSHTCNLPAPLPDRIVGHISPTNTGSRPQVSGRSLSFV